MLRFSQYPSEERVFMVNRKTRGDSFKAIRYDYKKFFPLSGREPNKMTIDRNKKKFDKEGKIFLYFIFC